MIRIGVLVDDLSLLSSWQYEIIQLIKNDARVDLALILTKQKDEYKKAPFKFELQKLAEALLSYQLKLEHWLFKLDKNFVGLGNAFEGVDVLEFQGQGKGEVLRIDEHILSEIKGYKLDLIIKLVFGEIGPEIQRVAKHGLWTLHFTTFKFSKFSSYLCKNLLKDETIYVSLVKSTLDAKNPIVIGETYFNKNWSLYKTINQTLEGLAPFLMKNVLRLHSNENFYTKKQEAIELEDKFPQTHVFNYLMKFYVAFLKKMIRKGLFLFVGIRSDCWTIFIGKGDVFNAKLSALTPLNPGKGQYWADPFFFKFNDSTYVFFENYSFIKKKGKISCGRIVEDKLMDVCDVLDLDYHLSFPYIFEENGEIYLMPEACANNRLEIWKCSGFPNKWELFVTAFEGEKVLDAFFFRDSNSHLWLFANKQRKANAPMDSELYIYQVDSIKLNTLVPHKQNPVLIDARVARNAGAIFEYQGKYFRPSQANINGVYGYGLNINSIKKLTLDEYEEETVKLIKPNFMKGLVSTHHLHQVNGFFVLDAAYGLK